MLQAYNQVIFLSPDNANAYHNRGLLYQHLKQEEQAIADFSEAIRLNPRHIKAHTTANLLMEGRSR
ncbi:tetratricopeptide repeat protein [Okeania hirsuta]|uniref:Tetratricopeptide repeat protein n=1 Tax=Okeania hirsuta TaxID=1458930 RepID=A0A3N6NNA5_9CYAN|nr:tetratricopeptide repeat protein [Okeania hirsuta]